MNESRFTVDDGGWAQGAGYLPTRRTPYHVGDPGDETTPRLGYTADEVEEVALGEYAPLAIEDCEMTPRRARDAAVGMAPSAEEMAAAIRWVATAWKATQHEYDMTLDFMDACNAMEQLAARLPRGSR